MQLSAIQTVMPSCAQSLLGVSRPSPEPLPPPVLHAADAYTPSQGATGDKIKSALVVGGLGLIGAGLGVYAGMGTGVLAGLAGTVAGASGGISAAAASKSGAIKTGALAGALVGTLVGASVSHPAAAVILGIAGATLPVALIMGVMSGAE